MYIHICIYIHRHSVKIVEKYFTILDANPENDKNKKIQNNNNFSSTISINEGGLEEEEKEEKKGKSKTKYNNTNTNNKMQEEYIQSASRILNMEEKIQKNDKDVITKVWKVYKEARSLSLSLTFLNDLTNE